MRLASLLILICLIASCKEDEDVYITPINDIKGCNIDDPLNQLDWLNEIALKAQDDNTGNYLGKIWIFYYSEKDIIVTDMALGSGGILFHIFDCQGNTPGESEIPALDKIFEYLTDDNLIFSSIPN